MEDLIEQLEKATEPDTSLDYEIEAKLNPMEADDKSRYGVLPAYTASIDAALTLVPEPHIEGDKGRVVESRWDFASSRHYATVNYDYHGRGTTPAIALCIAALKARLLTAGKSGA